MLFLICLAVLAFASTNIDGLLVLLGFLADPSYRPWQVMAGQYLGMGILVAVSLLLSQVSRLIPQAYVGLFGLVPVAIGIVKLWGARRRDAGCALEATPRETAVHFGKILTISAVTVSKGGDNVGMYVPLFAGLAGSEVAGIVAVFAAMTAGGAVLRTTSCVTGPSVTRSDTGTRAASLGIDRARCRGACQSGRIRAAARLTRT